MNLRVDDLVRDTRKRYHYFVYYMFEVDGGTGEGMVEITLRGRKITSMKDIRDICNWLVDNSEKTEKKKWNKVILRNFILLREEGEENGPEPREEKASTEDDPEVLKGSQG